MKNKIKTVCNNIRFLFKPVWKYGKIYVLVSMLSAAFIAPLAPVTYVLLTQKVVDSIANGYSFWNAVVLICVLYGANMGVWLVRTGIRELYLDIKKDKIIAQINIDTYYQGVATDYKYFDDPEFYDNYTLAASEYSGKSLSLVDSICSLVTALSTIAALVGIIATSGIVIIALAILQLLLTTVIETKRNRINLQKREDSIPFERKISYVHRTMYSRECAQDIKTTNVKSILLNILNHNVDGLYRMKKNYAPKIFGNSILNVLTAFLSEGGIMVFICYGIIISGSIQGAGMFLGMFYAAQNLVSNLQDFFSVWVSINEYSIYADKIMNFYSLSSPIESNKTGMLPIGATPFSIQFKNVTFSYPNSSFSLKNINLEIKPGEKIAIVGENGAGKSTLAKLLLRLYDVNDGEILFNNESIKNYDINELRKYIGVSIQFPQVYAMTLSDNLSLYRYIGTNESNELISRAGLAEILRKNEATIDTQMTKEFDKNGIVMSGGETQKVSLARIMASKYGEQFGLIVLDEPSSALDPLAEYDLEKKINDESNTNTTIIISHRLSMVTHVNRIVVISDGEIVENGTHQELMRNKAKYYDMFTKQAENYNLEHQAKKKETSFE